MPGPSDDVPRWQPPSEPSDDVPRWDPEADVPRWEPPAGAAALDPDTRARRAPVKRVSSLARPFVWWSAHPWVVAWAGVLLAPAGVLLLRIVDESGLERFVEPLRWTLLALLALVLARGAVFSAGRSPVRLVLGLVSALAAVAVLLWPVTRVTLGRVTCPARAGVDIGVPTAAAAIQAWQLGASGDASWRGGEADAAWREKTRAIDLLDYQLVDSGCFERVAPIDASRTWHDFRVTIKEGERPPLSKVVVVRTVSEGGGWKIIGIEGPLP